MNTIPGMFLQSGFLRDVLVILESEGIGRYYTDIRHDYIRDGWLGTYKHYYAISFEYGRFAADPFSVERDPSPEMGSNAPYLQPVIRRFNAGKLAAEHDINDDLESQWEKGRYVGPARRFFEEQLGGKTNPVAALRWKAR